MIPRPAPWEPLIDYAVKHNRKRKKKLHEPKHSNDPFPNILIAAFVNGCVTAAGFADWAVGCAYSGERGGREGRQAVSR